MVTLDIHTGAVRDPVNLKGMTHLVEHLIHDNNISDLKPAGFLDFAYLSGIYYNAKVDSEHTNYCFKVKSRWFDESLKRLGNLFVHHTLNVDMRELNLIQDEYESWKQSPYFVMKQMLFGRANEDNRFNHFIYGSRKSLTQNSTNLTEEAQRYYEKWYSADIMKAIIRANKTICELKQMASSAFGGIRNTNARRLIEREIPPLFNSTQL